MNKGTVQIDYCCGDYDSETCEYCNKKDTQ